MSTITQSSRSEAWFTLTRTAELHGMSITTTSTSSAIGIAEQSSNQLGDIRMCIDSRPLTVVSIPDRYPEDLIDKLAEARFFNTARYELKNMTPLDGEEEDETTLSGVELGVSAGSRYAT
ncbi:hypothetical protein EX30DRAFT_351208 [Ascodesmis nigricans]|uniref:Uncharacterized protein n=1 Tax=Ascodesmis nigricans TaxID=341454 RepID=A0A4S2MME1_9PEZI|nr:hypothetical protein EX30DRAFT_351208 [Ascodesmis nigricans]